MNEEWRPSPSYPGFRASSLGRVMRPSGHIAKLALDRDGYARVEWREAGSRKSAMQHTVVADAFLGPRPPGYEVDHIDGARSNNRPENLRYLTHDDNVKATAAAGRSARGERHADAVLTEDQAIAILREFTRPPSKGHRRPVGGLRDLASRYGVDRKTVYRLITGNTWPHLEVERAAMRQRLAALKDSR